ncbi:unnamed protein product [Caenorhabditis angaria]|uniref:Pre-rRNA-processing protein TSR2 homolog n=1 Tax=Caenorhabditis angaria TaxID=860376 RepID=A0A9P1IKX7_9PELO|nr:unnamed protein product [Caenorhabditis angaria]
MQAGASRAAAAAWQIAKVESCSETPAGLLPTTNVRRGVCTAPLSTVTHLFLFSSFSLKMAQIAENYREFVKRVLGAWSGYQLALDNCCGGDETREKSQWIIDVIAEYVITTRNLKADEMEEWLTNILYHDFDLILEDDSIYQTAFLLLEAYGYIKNGNEAGLQQLLSNLPSDEDIAKIKKQSVRGAEDEDMEMDDLEEDDDDNEEEEAGSSQREYAPRRVKEVDEDGWTTITRR